MEKYYTSTIEELCIGMWNVEVKVNEQEKEWMKFPIKNARDLHLIEDNFQLIRVKYLDKEDIESLGWKHIQGKEYDKDGFTMIFTFNGKILSIFRGDDPDFFFKGRIKNKSELRKLMEQLNIE